MIFVDRVRVGVLIYFFYFICLFFIFFVYYFFSFSLLLFFVVFRGGFVEKLMVFYGGRIGFFWCGKEV